MKSEKVWDIFVRTFHWTLVGSMIGLYLSGDDFESVHTILGYFVICLVLLRIIWGFIGAKHARFHDFLYRPSKTYHYLKSLINGNPTHYIGHNPAGGLMVIVMLLSLLVTAFTGLKTLGSEGKGPLTNAGISILRFAHADEDEDDDDDQTYKASHHQKNQKEEFWEEIHESMTSFMIFLIITHLVGVIVSSWIHKENLILAMINGRKKTL
jgi:cytochrome b